MEETSDNANNIRKLLSENTERLKELACINQTTLIIKDNRPVEETLQKVVNILPRAWQYPEHTVARITFGSMEYVSPDFQTTMWRQSQPFSTIDKKKGEVEIFYTQEFPFLDEGPFLKEERNLIDNIVHILTAYLNGLKAQSIIKKGLQPAHGIPPATDHPEVSISSRQLLHRYLNKQNYDRDIFHDLMPFKVRELLLVANLYDAYYIEKEGHFAEHILGEYHHLGLTSMPRVTGVSTEEEAFAQLNTKHFDLIIFMMGVDKSTPAELSKKIRAEFPYIPVFLLLNNNSDIEVCERNPAKYETIDKVFVWNGDSRVFFAMVKHLEDKVNLENDTKIGLVRVILLVEDSARYYSRYLPLLYSNVLEQTKRIIEDVSSDEFLKVLRLRARPKILLASSFEEAVEIMGNYRDNMLCLISDVRFFKDGELDEDAGFKLVEHVRTHIRDLPIILQSSEQENATRAYEQKCIYIDKNSATLLQDIQSFITHYLGFGNFVYKNKEGAQIAVARSLKEFETHLRTIPDESLLYHSNRDHFSLWLMARGEIQIAKFINPYKIADFKSTADLREFLLGAIRRHRNEQNKGKVISYDENEIMEESYIMSLASGSLGGKGRGVAFINTLIYSFDFHQLIPNINIRAPKTLIIGTDEFGYFMDRNNFYQLITEETDYQVIRKAFMEGRLSDGLVRKLRRVLKLLETPLAVRSSGLFEDSIMQPFAGIFETYLLPNSHLDLGVRLEQLCNAIKLVYASVYSPMSRGYIEAINYKLEEERMAIVLQEVVGNRFESYHYPHISGVAQSYNYYPFAHMKPEEGFAVAAAGLGCYVVEGEKAYRFSPKYPTTEINSPKDQFKNSQVHFYAIDLGKTNVNLIEGELAGLAKLDIEVAEKHGNLRHCASVYDFDNESIVPGLTHAGPRIINFSNILKYNYIPMAETIQIVLDVVQEALGSPVEIEFAIDLNKDEKNRASFFILQIKPLIGSAQDFEVNMNEIKEENILLYTEKCMGNGKIDDITDVIYVDVSKFDKTQTEKMAAEIEALNRQMINSNRKYLLFGPGRWGTRDRFIGIPVNWPQISHAKIIVETSLEDFPLDASSGSHFFHNVTSMNVGYFTVQPEMLNSYIRYEVLDRQELVAETEFFRHVRFARPLTVRMDGKKRISVITFDE
jgi:hypothetical protein